MLQYATQDFAQLYVQDFRHIVDFSLRDLFRLTISKAFNKMLQKFEHLTSCKSTLVLLGHSNAKISYHTVQIKITILPEQCAPSPSKPILHLHVNEPGASWHDATGLHGFVWQALIPEIITRDTD